MINPDGTLSSPQDTIATDGDSPAFAVALSTGQVGVMNFGSGNGRVIPTTSGSLIFDQNSAVETFPQKPNTVSHPHMVLEHGNEIFVPDLVGIVHSRTCKPEADSELTGARYHLEISSERG